MGELPVSIQIRSYLSQMQATLGKAKTHVASLTGIEDAPTLVITDPNEALLPLARIASSPMGAKRPVSELVKDLPANLKANWNEIENAFKVMERSLDIFVEELGLLLQKTELTDFDQRELVRHFSCGPRNFEIGLKMLVDSFKNQFADHKDLSKFVMNRFFAIQVRASKIAQRIVELPVTENA